MATFQILLGKTGSWIPPLWLLLVTFSTARGESPEISLVVEDLDPWLVSIEIYSNDPTDELCDVQYSTDLVEWRTIASVSLADGYAWLEAEDLPVGGARVFYRILMEDESSVSAVLNLPEFPYNYADIELPDHLTTDGVKAEDNTPGSNPVTDSGATLGRVLFYDVKLSLNEAVSCATCHVQEKGFSDPLAFSVGFEGELTERNSMGLASARFYERGHFFWDERADTLEDQTLMPIQDPIEMGMTLELLAYRLQKLTYYQVLFEEAFGDEEVTSDRIALALSQFVRSMVNHQSKYDEGEQSGFANFTDSERRGLGLFNSTQTQCNDCHSGPNFVGDQIENNGLEFPYIDLGVGGVTGRAQDEGKFKMSSLRNIEVTGPYMHDGRFETLEDVIGHYSNGVVANPNLGNELVGRGNNPNQPNFSEQETADLVAFLKTLTDHEFLNDPKFSDPFKNEGNG